MKTAIVIFAGLTLSSNMLADERFRMKYGRDTPAEEARQKAAYPKAAAPTVAVDAGIEARYRMKYGRGTPGEEASKAAASDVYANNLASGPASSCFGEPPDDIVATGMPAKTADAGAEARYRMKYGRGTPATERMLASADRMMCDCNRNR